jgi:hypothetical protein
MLHLILAVAGLASGGGIIGLVAKFGLKTVLGNAGAFIKRVPRWAWIALAVVLAIGAGAIWHGRQLRAHDKALTAQVIADRDVQWNKRLAAEHAAALAWKAKADQQLQTITQMQRKVTDEETRRIAADAAAVRLRGPGAAAAPAGCRPGHPAELPGIAGRPVAQPGGAANAGTEVPAEDGSNRWAIVPWDWAVDVVSERDAFRVEAIGWRSWHASIAAYWQRMQQEQQRQQSVKEPSQ